MSTTFDHFTLPALEPVDDFEQPANCFVLALDLLYLEAAAIFQCAQRLHPQQLTEAVCLLAECRGKVVLVGIGKSGIIAQKIAGTLNSLGAAAIFLHPSNAMHGDIGGVSMDDVVVVVSNSGQTEEVLDIIPHLKSRRVPIIAIVGNLRSALARRADVVLDAAVEQEACPFNLTPTASTIVALAIGDALAMSLIHMKGITREALAVNHPSGWLGKRLTMRVRDLMHSGPDNPTVSAAASWLDVVSSISRGGLGAVSVVDEVGRLLGLIIDADLRRCMQHTSITALERLTAAAIMTQQPETVSGEMLAYEALRIMQERGAQTLVLPVVNQEQQVIGLIRLHDLVRSGL
jgi:arabinose-5-phosphate isomerase